VLTLNFGFTLFHACVLFLKGTGDVRYVRGLVREFFGVFFDVFFGDVRESARKKMWDGNPKKMAKKMTPARMSLSRGPDSYFFSGSVT
jgi:hypothetical protein